MYKKALVAIDGSDVSNGAFESELQLAKTENAQALLLYVIEYPKPYMPEVGYDPKSIYGISTRPVLLVPQKAAIASFSNV